MLKKVIKVLFALVVTAVIIFLAYFSYVFLTYYRVEDHLTLAVESMDGEEKSAEQTQPVKLNESYTIVTHNLGFGAYIPEFSFFMDGGTESWAFSKEAVQDAISGAAELVKAEEPDYVLTQELDLDGTRSYHVDEVQLFWNYYPSFYKVFAQNYDSPFLAYPLTQPHGANLAGLATFSKYMPNSAERRSFPVSDGVKKLIDLDRCYSVTRIPVENGKLLCIYNVHMSAYGADETVMNGQITMLTEDMEAEYEKGNYVVCGGDFNHNLELGEDDAFTASWAKPFPRSMLPDGFRFAIDELSKEEMELLEDSCRDANEPYQPGHTETYMLDGFLISDNVAMDLYQVLASGYSYSDHDPVLMQFHLK